MLAALELYTPLDAREALMVERCRAFVANNPACFERSLAIGHITGSAWVIDRAHGAVVLVHHRKLDRWLQPGGHADGDPDVRGVALREATEETGIGGLTFATPDIFDVDVHEIPARESEPAHEHFDIRFAFYAPAGSKPAVSPESHAVAWVALAEIDPYRVDDSVRRLVTKTGRL